MGHLKDVLRNSKCFSIGFSVASKGRKKRVRFREGRRLLDLDVLVCDRGALFVKSQVTIMTQFLGAISRAPEIFICAGVTVDVMMTWDRCPSSNVSDLYPYDVRTSHREKLLRKPSCSVLGRIDM